MPDLIINPAPDQVVEVRIKKAQHEILFEEEDEEEVKLAIRPRRVRSDDYHENMK